MKVLIIDDERLARDELRYLLTSFSQIKIIGEAKGIEDAQALIEDEKPDCIFLDINMPGGDGFKLLESLTFFPHVIFTTAYAEFALKAFDVGAIDYLVKPIDPKRLESAISRVTPKIKVEEDSDCALGLDEHIFIKDNDQCWFIPVKKICLCESIGNYTRIYFDGNKPMIKRSLSYLESRLPASHFFRANRHFIVNLEFIRNIEVLENNGLEITVNGVSPIEMSRRQAQKFKAMRGL